MKILVDNALVLELNETQKKVIKDEIHEDIFDEDMKRRVSWVLTHKYNEVFKKFKQEWDPKLASNGIKMIPTDKDEYAKLVFSQPDYKSKAQRVEADSLLKTKPL
jgi:hypothetical protein